MVTTVGKDEQRIDALNTAMQSGMFMSVRKSLKTLPPADIAHLIESSPSNTRNLIWGLIEEEQQGEVLPALPDEIRTHLMINMEPRELAAATEGLEVDDIVDVLQDLPENIYKRVLEHMSAQNREDIETVFSYPEDTAGGLMNTDAVVLRQDLIVEVVLRYLRMRKALPEGTDALYVTDNHGKYTGSITLSALLTSDPSNTLESIMDKEAEAILVDTAEKNVAQVFERHDLISAPVIDEEGRILGRITIDDVVDVIREMADHSLMGMAGLDEEADTFAPVVKSTRERAVWLGINLITALVAASVNAYFEATLDKIVSLAILMIIVPSMGGVAGSQTLTLMIRAIALGQVNSANYRWLIYKEIAVGFLNGLMWAVVISTLAYAWKGEAMIGVVIGAAMLINLIVAGLSGVGIPLIMKKLNIDPAIAGSVVLTTITDVVGLAAFLGLATWLL